MLNEFIKSFIIVGLLLIVAACGGSGDDSEPMLTGQVADGYLSGAIVFLDRNGNKMLDSDEPWAESGSQGRFSIEINRGEGELYPVVAEIIAGKTFDEDTQQYVSESYRLEAPAGKWSFVSPLTTLVKNELDKNPSLSRQAAEDLVRQQLGLGNGVSLFENYIQLESAGGSSSVHRAGRIVAGLMGRLQKEIDLNIGAVTAESQRSAVSLMISDQIMYHSDAIAQNVNSGQDNTVIEEIKSDILKDINTSNLDSKLLDQYVQRMQSSSPVWDMLPPKIIAQTPLVDGSAPVDVIVSLTYDEEITPSSITEGTIKVIGPNGDVPGTVEYIRDLKQLNFITDSYLMAFSSYQVDIAGVADIYGNNLDQTHTFYFTTIFDQIPPDLPDF